MKFELARVERVNLGLSAGAVAASLALVSPHFAGSLAAGAFLEALNLGAIHRGAKRLFTGEIEGARTWIGLFSMRFLTLAAAIFVTMQAGADVAALLIGLSITMPATVIDAWLNRPPVVDPATLPSFVSAADAPANGIAGDQDEDEYWENYSVWRPGRLITSERDDLLSEAAAQVAADEKALERAQFEQARAAYDSDNANDHAATRTSAQDEETR